jgi:hypothetical protein
VAAIELRLEGIDVFVADARRWLIDGLRTGERERPLTTSEAEARDRLLKAAERSGASIAADAILPPSSADQENVGLAPLAAWVNWVAMAFDLSERWPSCWYRHEGLVFEMQSLRRWHVALGTDLATDPSSAIRWSEALHRVNTQSARHVAQRCLSAHRDAPPLDPVDVHTDEESTALVAATTREPAHSGGASPIDSCQQPRVDEPAPA